MQMILRMFFSCSYLSISKLKFSSAHVVIQFKNGAAYIVS